MKEVLPLNNQLNRDGIVAIQRDLMNALAIYPDTLEKWKLDTARMIRPGEDIGIFCAFILHMPSGEQKTLNFFWIREPDEGTRAQAEQALRAEHPALDSGCAITHTALPARPRHDIGTGPLRFAVRANNQADMIAGLAMPAGFSWIDAGKMLADTLLSALLAIGTSVRTLSGYSRDLSRFSTRDPLTGLYNQAAFWDLLSDETERAKRQNYSFSLLLADIDNFKSINDTYGHEIGDAYLKQVSALVKTAIRGADTAARHGADEFGIILSVCDEAQAVAVARRITELVREFCLPVPTGEPVRGTVSIGIAVCPDHARNSRDLFLLAESILSRVKSFGKDHYAIPEEQDDIEVVRTMGEKNIFILNALSKKQIVPYFQPIMNVRTGRIEAHEVLTRIVVHDRVFPAADFIETAEQMGSIGRIDYQLIDLAFAKVRETGYQGSLFLNLSPKALVLNEFMPTVRRFLADYRIDPSVMVFEITERDTVKNLNVVERFIRELRGEGFRFAIDDFGSGYSSFLYLKTFSVDYLKVDGEFIRNMSGNGSVETAIVTSIASLAEDLGIKTIAEYVENKRILDRVGSAGIDFAQGFYIQKPSPNLI